MKNLRILALAHPDLIPPDDPEGFSDEESYVWKTEYDVLSTLRGSGHEVKMLGVQTELTPIRDEVENFKPDIVFNLLEEFHGETLYAQNVVSLLELLRIPYTGCNPRGQLLARGIAQASVVDTDEKLAERVAFIHKRIKTAAIAEEYIDGREIYVGVLGNDRLQVLPVWELEFSKLAEGNLPIATEKVKHDPDYQEKRGVVQGPAEGLSPTVVTRIRTLAKRICHTLELDGYSRIDFRLTKDDVPYFIEANPNPEISAREEFAQAALHAGMTYPELLNKILTLGLRREGIEA